VLFRETPLDAGFAGDSCDIAADRRSSMVGEDRHQFRFIVAPEDVYFRCSQRDRCLPGAPTCCSPEVGRTGRQNAIQPRIYWMISLAPGWVG
jgi:hypothetical protein